MIVYILINLYHKNSKDLKEVYRFIRFLKNCEFLKIHLKLQELVKKSNKK